MSERGEITFKGDLHTIPAGATLVLKADRPISMARMAVIREQLACALGDGHRVLVVGPEFEVHVIEKE